MPHKTQMSIIGFVLLLMVISLACQSVQPVPTSTPAPSATDTPAPTATQTPRPSPTLRPTRTPDLAATQHTEELNAEVESYFEKGYLTTRDGEFTEVDDFREEWAQLGWYSMWLFRDTTSDLFMSAHFRWESAYRNADISGCGFVFDLQDNDNQDHYAVFLDRSKVYFVDTSYYYRAFGPTRGTGLVNFDNPANQPVEADFTLIVNDIHAYVLVDGKLVGEYTLSQSKAVRGKFGLALLSGTNKDFGTRCEMTNLHYWIPDK